MIVITKQNIVLIKRILKYLVDFKRKLIFIVATMIISTIINYVLPIINKEVIDNGLQKNNFMFVLKYTLISLALVIMDQLLVIVATKLSAYLNNILNYKLTSISIKKLINIKMSYLNNKNFTEIMNNINMDVPNVSRIVDQTFILRILNIFKIIGGLIGLIKIDYKLAGVTLIIIPIKCMLTSYFIKISKKYYKQYMNYSKEYSKWYGDRLGGVKEIKINCIENAIKKQFSVIQRNLIKTNIKSEVVDSIFMGTETCFFQAVSSFIYIFGSLMIIKKSFTIGGLFAFTTYSMRVIQQVSALFNIKYDFAKIMLSANRLFEFLDKESETDNLGKNRITQTGLLGNIEFKNVSFSYPNDLDNTILKNITFDIKTGEKVALVGLNGCGKSTILNILLKLYEIHDGSISIDGINLEDINTKDLRQAISMVNQNAYVFNATIKENVTLFKAMDNEKVEDLLKLSGAYSIVQKQSNGIETKLGDRGSKLSGGELQKVILARAFAKASNIIILDEVTSNFDLQSEKVFNETLLTKFKKQTVILITHRPYILSKLDKIIVIDNGSIVDFGKHEELINRCEIYSKIINQVV